MIIGGRKGTGSSSPRRLVCMIHFFPHKNSKMAKGISGEERYGKNCGARVAESEGKKLGGGKERVKNEEVR